MTLSTQTWRISANYTFTIAGTVATVAEVLAGINTMIAAEAGAGGKWGVSNYSSGNGTLEVKATGSPAGTLATFRALLFGGATPNAAALATSVAAASTSLYIGISQDANTTGPEASYTAGSPYPSSRWTGGVLSMLVNQIPAANSPVMFIVESTEILAIFVSCTTGVMSIIVGAVAESVDSPGTPLWCAFGSNGGTLIPSTSEGNSLGPSIGWIIPAYRGASTAYGVWHNGSAKRQIGRTLTGLNTAVIATAGDPLLSAGGAAILIPMHLSESGQSSAPGALCGFLRQMRFGPYMTNRQVIKDGSSVTQALFVGLGTVGTTYGLYFDMNP